MKPFKQVDVFCARPYSGNPLAVVFDADDLSAEQMQAIAFWMNLSETTFLQSPTVSDADYRVRIFSPSAELPFAGHPSVGTAFAAIDAGMIDADATQIVQQCGAGLIRLSIESEGDDRTVFVTSPTAKLAPVPLSELDELPSITPAALADDAQALVVDVGARWLTLELPTEASLRGAQPETESLMELSRRYSVTGLTIFALSENDGYQVAVRSFAPAHGIAEDPVCGSGNVSVAAHLLHTGRISRTGARYTANQGREIGHDGLVRVEVADGGNAISVGGHAMVLISGDISLGAD